MGLKRVRLQAGVALFALVVRSTVKEATMTATEFDMGYVLGAGVTLHEAAPLRLGFDVRLGLITDAGTAFGTVGIFASFDIVAAPIVESAPLP